MEQFNLTAIAAQSTGFKTTISHSKDTGVFITQQLVSFLGFEDGANRVDISFNIYKNDCIKALISIIRSLPLFISPGGVCREINNSYSFFKQMYDSIISFFGEEEVKLLGPCKLNSTSQNRRYIFELEHEGLNIRNLFVSGYTDLSFCKYDDGHFDLRFVTRECRATSDISAVMMNTHYDKETKQLIYYGAPGTGKSYSIKWLHGITKDNSFRTTFHPDSDYSTFVGCYKPVQKPGEDKISYDFIPQVFTDAYIAAWRGYKESNPIFLIIEEINRGNCAQVFGDLFQLLDRNEKGFSDYEIKPEKDLQKYLQEEFSGNHQGHPKLDLEEFPSVISGEELILPPNLNIIATMNTSDQSLFPIDSAFKRRWDWKYTPINYSPLNKDNEPLEYKIVIDGSTYDWSDFIYAVNGRIFDLLKSEDKQLGYFFVRPKKDEEITEDVFVSKVIFYLWSDIYKDYVSREKSIFRINGTDYSFNKFFEDNEINTNLVKFFIEQFVEDETKGLSGATTGASQGQNSKRKHPSYKVNDREPVAGRMLAKEIMKEYVKLNPDLTPEQVLAEWKSLNIDVKYFVELKEEYEGRKKMLRSEDVRWGQDLNKWIYVTTHGWTFYPSPSIPDPTIPILIDAVEAKEWNIKIEIIEP